MRFIASPHLPQNPVTLALIGARYREALEKSLEGQGIEVLWLPDNPHVDTRLAGHADLSALHLGENRLMLAAYLEGNPVVIELTNRGFQVIFASTPQKAAYPGDCGLNVCLLGEHILHNPATMDPQISHYVNHMKPIPVRQGYTKCAVCAVNDHSIITADQGVHVAAQAADFDTLLIESDGIQLPGFVRGFAGGAAFKLSPDTLAFTGGLDACPSKARIAEFLRKRNIRMLSLTQNPIFDIGSVILLKEKA